MDAVQGNHKHTQKGNILAVEKGMPVDTGMQQENQHCEQPQQPAAGHPIGQQIAEKPADDKEQMRHQMPGQIDGARILQPGDAFHQQGQQLKSGPVKSVVRRRQRVIPAPGKIQGGHGEVPLEIDGIAPSGVVVQDKDAHRQQGRAHRQRPDPMRRPGQPRRRPAHAIPSPAHLRLGAGCEPSVKGRHSGGRRKCQSVTR